ncbi:MAG: GAF domain-containing protein [Anaerolineales bacterium]|nr:GAF domain-containing protein [Anaerolineales bacterium]
MPGKTPSKSNKVKAKPTPKKPAPKMDVDKIRALEEQIAHREVEISRLSSENQLLIKETEQHATELQIINNIGQILTEDLDLNSTLERVGERMRDVLSLDHIGIIVLDPKTGHEMSRYFYSKTYAYDYMSFDKFKIRMRLSARGGGRSWIVNTNAAKSWRKFGEDIEAPKSFVALPLLAGKELIGGILFADFEKENAFTDLSINMVETIASNMGTAIQNVRLFDETQRLLKETEQRATELQIINNIGQTLTEGGDLESMIQRVGERIQEALNVNNIIISIFDKETERIIANYMVRNGEQTTLSKEDFNMHAIKIMMRASARRGGVSWVIKDDEVEKFWHRWRGSIGDDVPKSVVVLPLLAGREVIGGISLADYEKENAFTDLSLNLLETIASNMGTAVQNVRLFDETQRLLKETEQRATELQIINNIGQTLTEGLDLNSTLERVGERLREVLDVKALGIVAFDPQAGLAISNYIYHYGRRIIPQRFSMSNYKYSMRFALKVGSKPWVVNSDVERYWKKFGTDILTEWTEIPKAFVIVPMLAGRELVGSITIADYENENAFFNLPLNLLETIASNMGTAIQNVRLFDETQRLLKETEQRATELQIVNNIGQTLSEGLDLSTTLERVGDRLREALKIESIGIIANDIRTGLVISAFVYLKGKRVIPDRYSLSKNMLFMRFVERTGGKPVVINTNVEKNWRKFLADSPEWAEIPKAFVMVPLLAGGELVGSITIPDYEREDVFTNLPINMLETIASNMGTAIQNVRLFDETQHLLKETEQRATELQIINNIGQTLTEGLDLQSTLDRVGDRLREILKVDSIGIAAFDPKSDRVIAQYLFHHGERLIPDQISTEISKFAIRFAARWGGRSWVVNTDAEKYYRKFELVGPPKSFVMLPLLSGKEIIGGISIADYEKENAFTNFPIGMLETISSNMGTAIQNVRLFEETQRLFEEAEESRAAAEQANKAKSTFLANMSHELRTPLNAIMGFTQIVKGKAEGVMPEKQINNLEKVLTSSQHLLGLINTVLDIAKIEAGRMDVIPAKFSLSILADQCGALAAPLLKPNVLLEKQVDESIGFVFSDQDKIKQIVLNLLSNAAKFTHEGKVILKVEKIDGEVAAISVADSGIGISKEAVGRVFEEFQQADNTTTRQYGGTGLGLTISRNLARLLGGDLTAASELGKGSTFTLTFPMHYKKDPALRHGSASQDSASSAAIMDTVHSAETTPIESSNQIERRSEPQPRTTILVVEDTELNVNFITQLLEDDYELIFAKNGAQGVTLAGLEKPDLILMDISLPILDGYEATRRIRINNADTPIIGLSAYAMVGDAEKAKEAGCNDYITKPVDGNLLRKKIKEHLR